jgi:hypothetical protein
LQPALLKLILAAGTVNRECGTETAMGVGSGDFHEKAVMSKNISTLFFLANSINDLPRRRLLIQSC